METSDSLADMADLALFVHVVDQRGFTAAARRLGLSKSAVSKRLDALEKRLGLRLLQRSTRAMSLTEAGQQLYARAAQAVALIDEARQLAGGLGDAPRGRLRVTASVTFGKLCLAPLLPEFLARYPEIRVELALLDRFVDLVDEGYDLALRLTRQPPPLVVARPLLPIGYRLCASPDYLRGRRIEHPDDLAGLNGLAYHGRDGDDAPWQFRRGDESCGVRVGGNCRVNNSEVVRDLLLAGVGVGLVWDYAVAREIAAGRLVALLPEWTPQGPFGQTAYALWLPQAQLPRKIRVFVDFLAERLRAPTNFE